MNREAALLGTPVISCYPGKLLAVDSYYIKKGLMKRSTDLDEIVNISLGQILGERKELKIETDDLFQILLESIYRTASNQSVSS